MSGSDLFSLDALYYSEAIQIAVYIVILIGIYSLYTRIK